MYNRKIFPNLSFTLNVWVLLIKKKREDSGVSQRFFTINLKMYQDKPSKFLLAHIMSLVGAV